VRKGVYEGSLGEGRDSPEERLLAIMCWRNSLHLNGCYLVILTGVKCVASAGIRPHKSRSVRLALR